MGQQATSADDRFRPTSTASGLRLIAAIVFGPLLWVVGLVIVAVWCTSSTRSSSAC